MPITLNVITGEFARESVERVPISLSADGSQCAFCDMPLEDTMFGIACCECASEVWQCCEQCESPTYASSGAFDHGRVSGFARAVALSNPRYGGSINADSPPLPHAPQSFLPLAFGLGSVPNARIRPEDDRHIFVCSDCVVNCDSCGLPYRDPDSAEECCVSDLFSCEECGEQWEESYEAVSCCDPGSGLLRDYCYRPPLRFWRMQDGLLQAFTHSQPRTLFMGMELELEKATGGVEAFLGNADEFSDAYPSFLWVKSDGSLGSQGVELVTMPSTLSAFRKRFPFAALEQWRKDGARSYAYSSCGIHIHVSRSAFDPPHMWRFVRFQLWNSQLCQLVAQREASSYAQWTEGGAIQGNESDSLPDFIKGKDANRNRYVAINFQNDQTVELRYFKGNITEASILAKLSYVDSLYRFTKQLTYRDCASGALRNSSAYLAWLADEEYPELIEFLREREAI